MKLTVNKNQLREHPEQFLRQAGYGIIRDGRSGELSFRKLLTRNFYPRLHMYFQDRGDFVVFDLHLDQTQEKYGGGRNHGSEYDGPVVENEIARLRDILNAHHSVISAGDKKEDANLEGGGSYLKDVKNFKPEKKWWQKIFGI